MNRRNFMQAGAALAAATLPLPQLSAQVHREAAQSVTSETHYDAIVLGVGSMGSATCYYLARQGWRVLGLEQFDIPHELGSHAGQSRIIRKAYFEHPDYVPLLERAYHNWQALEAETGARLYHKTGLLYFGQPGHALIKGLRESATRYHIRVDDLTAQQQAARFAQFTLPGGYDRLIEPDAGFVTPERAVLLYTQRALQLGATIRTHEKILSHTTSGNRVIVKTEGATYQASKLIITAGPWVGKMLPQLSRHLSVTRQVVGWVKPKDWKKFNAANFPCWTIADHEKPGIFYGFPLLPTEQFGGPIGLKLAHHLHGAATDPDSVNRTVTRADEAALIEVLEKFIPGAYASTLALKTCLYTNTPDENFILDFAPGQPNVVIACGFSGHGFKFASVVGEIMADLTMKGTTQQPIGFLNAKRFG